MDINQIMGIVQPTVTKTSGLVGDSGDAAQGSSKAYSQFGEIFKKAFENLEQTQAVTEKDNYDMAMGNFDNLHQAVINSEKAATALELTTQLTSRAVSAYNEIMRMQI
ncbi:MAG: flagellar hook-basal body complex protein FliE [Oscillospiraceae bacterium]